MLKLTDIQSQTLNSLLQHAEAFSAFVRRKQQDEPGVTTLMFDDPEAPAEINPRLRLDHSRFVPLIEEYVEQVVTGVVLAFHMSAADLGLSQSVMDAREFTVTCKTVLNLKDTNTVVPRGRIDSKCDLHCTSKTPVAAAAPPARAGLREQDQEHCFYDHTFPVYNTCAQTFDGYLASQCARTATQYLFYFIGLCEIRDAE